MRIVGTLSFSSSGELSFTGTGLSQAATNSPVQICDVEGMYFVGQIENVSAQECQIQLNGFFSLSQRFRLRANESLRIRGWPLDFISVFVNGTVTLRGIGTILEAQNDEDTRLLLSTSNIIERAPSIGATFNFPTYEDTNITTATTTTVADPAANLTKRIYKLTVSCQSAARPVIQWTDSDGTSNVNILGTLNFAGEGSFVYDFGDDGLICPNGIDGLLRIVSNNTAVLDIDVVSEDV